MMRLALAALVLTACHPEAAPAASDGGAQTDAEGVSPEEMQGRVAARALQVARCAGSGFFPDVSGIYAVLLETGSEVTGSLPGPQYEVITRYGIAQLCQDEGDVGGIFMLCTFDQSPLLDAVGTCAAEVPGPLLVANLPAQALAGTLDLVTERISLSGFNELWGLAEGATLPQEPAGAAMLEGATLLDQDEDGLPGVTVVGNGLTPTRAWVARQTTAELNLLVGRGGLAGTTTSQADQPVLGGPAARALRGRQRRGLGAEVLFVRADGLEGSARLDTNGDGLLTCGELGPWIGTALPAPRPWPCQP